MRDMGYVCVCGKVIVDVAIKQICFENIPSQIWNPCQSVLLLRFEVNFFMLHQEHGRQCMTRTLMQHSINIPSSH